MTSFKIWTLRESPAAPAPSIIMILRLLARTADCIYHLFAPRALLTLYVLRYPTCCPQPLPPLLLPSSAPITTECTLNQGCFSLRHRQNVHWVCDRKIQFCFVFLCLFCFFSETRGCFALKCFVTWGEVVSLVLTSLSSPLSSSSSLSLYLVHLSVITEIER